MKLVKFSLAIIFMISSIFASNNSKISGDARIYYGTEVENTANPKEDLFGKPNSIGDFGARVDYTRSLMNDTVVLNAGFQSLSLFGVDSEFVGYSWVKHNNKKGRGDAYWIDTLNMQIKLNNTLAMTVGRQALDTPFFFTETWNIAKNTFDAAIITNNDIPKTTLTAIWIGRGNGISGTGVVDTNGTDLNGGMATFSRVLGSKPKPTYAFAVVTKLIPNTITQAWYYKAPSIATAYWMQTDSNIMGIVLGAQYTEIELVENSNKTSGFAVKLGYGKGAWNAYGAYSSTTGNTDGIDISNIATGHTYGSQSKLYTESYWNYGYVGARNAKSFAVGAQYNLSSVKLNAHYTHVAGNTNNMDVKEAALTATTKLDLVDIEVAYINAEIGLNLDERTNSKRKNTLFVKTKIPFEL
ncbi:MAG: hypothetical protein LGB72_03565 [Sulfurovum sp.]|nr:hypothetical protein [Sulfurovum sp.]